MPIEGTRQQRYYRHKHTTKCDNDDSLSRSPSPWPSPSASTTTFALPTAFPSAPDSLPSLISPPSWAPTTRSCFSDDEMIVLFTAWMSGDQRRAEVLLAEPSPDNPVFDEVYVDRMYASLNLPLEEVSKDWCMPPSSSTPSPPPSQVAHSRYSNYIRYGNWCVRP